MNSERDANRIVRSWLEAGSNGIPDRVLDAVLSELPSTPQRRPRWSPWRSQTMNAFIKIGAVAAVVLLAVVVGSRFLPGDASIGVPAETSSPAPSPSPVEVRGQFVLFADHDYTLVFDALANGSTLSGTVAVSFQGGGITIGLQCARQFDAQTWMLAGEIEESSGEGLPVGTRIAVIVRDGSPQRASMWPANGPADDCADFVTNIPDNAVEGQDMIGPVEGAITLPPGPPANDVSGQFTFGAERGDYIVDIEASANGATLSGTAAVSFPGGAVTMGLQCARQFDAQTWMLAGEVGESSGEGLPIGTWMAVIVRDGSPQQVGIWPASAPTADCAEFVSQIPDRAVEGPNQITPVKDGEISLPASL
jgi:hypothetical protein